MASCDLDGACDGGACDTDASGTDTDPSAAPDADTSDALLSGEVRLEIDIESLPSDNLIRLRCDGRLLVDEARPSSSGTRAWSFPVVEGEICEVVLSDDRGGRLPAGRLYNCSREVASWPSQRGRRAEVAQVTIERCRPGCVDPSAENHEPNANLDDGSCEYVFGCMDPEAVNFDPAATRDDGTCDFGGFGRIEIFVHADGSPGDTLVRLVCDGRDALLMDDLDDPWTTAIGRTNVDAGFACDVIVEDRTGDVGPGGEVRVCEATVLRWEPLPGTGSPWAAKVGEVRTEACSGCTDPASSSFDPGAIVDDGECVYP